jgi:hypothetical protein
MSSLLAVQIWLALTFITEIKNRVVMVRLLRLTGVLRCCLEAARAADAAALAARKLGRAELAAAEQARARLELIEN